MMLKRCISVGKYLFLISHLEQDSNLHMCSTSAGEGDSETCLGSWLTAGKLSFHLSCGSVSGTGSSCSLHLARRWAMRLTYIPAQDCFHTNHSFQLSSVVTANAHSRL